MACVWYVCGRRGKLGGEQGRLHRGKGAECRRLNVAVDRNVARPYLNDFVRKGRKKWNDSKMDVMGA